MKNIAILHREENKGELENNYIKAVQKFGGIPILITEQNLLKLEECDGIILTGGDKKGKLDDILIKYALDKKIPLLGICQGMQSMALYGTSNKLIKINNHHHDKTYKHPVILSDSKLKNIIGKNKIEVNTYHYEAVTSSKYFNIVGVSDDLVIEAIENKNHSFQIGVQWHPEKMLSTDKTSNLIFKTFIDNCK